MAQPQHLDAQPIAKLRAPLQSSKPGTTIPRLGLGTWMAKKEDVGEAVRYAIEEAGIRHIDTAAEYKVEPEVGAAIKQVLATTDLTREELHLWNEDHARVEEACRESLSNLGLEYIDLWLMHWPMSGNKGPTVEPPLEATWKEMERMVDLGLVRAIGVSNFSVKKLKALLPHARKPLRRCRWRRTPTGATTPGFCSEHGIHMTAYSGLGSPHSAGHPAAHEAGKGELLEDAKVNEIAQRIGKTPQQVCIRWAPQRCPDHSVVVKSTMPEHIKIDADVAEWSLSDDDMLALSNLPQRRMLVGGVFLSQEGPYRTLKDLWDEQTEGAAQK